MDFSRIIFCVKLDMLTIIKEITVVMFLQMVMVESLPPLHIPTKPPQPTIVTQPPTPFPTPAPTPPTPAPTPSPTVAPTPSPTAAPTASPTPAPTPSPTPSPTPGLYELINGGYTGYADRLCNTTIGETPENTAHYNISIGGEYHGRGCVSSAMNCGSGQTSQLKCGAQQVGNCYCCAGE